MSSNRMSPARAHSNVRSLSLQFAGRTCYFLCSKVIILILICLVCSCSLSLALPQTTQPSPSPSPSASQSRSTPATLSGLSTPSSILPPGRPVVASSSQLNPTPTPPANQPPQQNQPKSLKFTLIAGKFWKFNIKTNGFSPSEGELRLHRNISVNNYIIDDDGWFQYNPQQQQLFAWPSLQTKPGTYYFVLLPSGVDFEADSENVVNPEVAANIVVELIRPFFPNLKSDIDHLIDYKFSLDYLHRHTAYPLLLQQIISILDGLAAKPSSTLLSKIVPSTVTPATATIANALTTPTAITTPLSALTAQLKGGKIAGKLSEYLLMSFTYTPDGEYFSLSWTTHPSLSNNTITSIAECRLSVITDTVTKLSSLPSGYQFGGDKDDIFYPLSVPYANSQAIVPTERGNRALKLTIYGPCRRAKTFEELGLIPTTTASPGDVSVLASDDRENNVEPRSLVTRPTLPSSLPGLPTPEAIDSSLAVQQPTSVNSTTPATTTSNSPSSDSSGLNSPAVENPSTTAIPEANATSSVVQTLTSSISTTASAASSTGVQVAPQDFLDSTQPTRVQEASEASLNVLNATTTGILAKPTDNQPQLQQQTKVQPQAKSFASYLDTLESKPDTLDMSSSTGAPKMVNISTLPTVTTPLSQDSSVSVFPPFAANVTSESSLNEDFIGILNDVMDYLVSVAVPLAIIVGIILLVSILVAICSLCRKRRKTKQFEVRNRFNFRYGSERRAFLKNSSKPVILEADQKSLSMGGTPQHRSSKGTSSHDKETIDRSNYLPMNVISASSGAEQPPNKAGSEIHEAIVDQN